MSMLCRYVVNLSKEGGGVKNLQNLVYVVCVRSLSAISLMGICTFVFVHHNFAKIFLSKMTTNIFASFDKKKPRIDMHDFESPFLDIEITDYNKI